MRCLFVAWAVALCAVPVNAKDLWSSVTPGAIVLFRHALAPGGGDPAGFQLSDCPTQRNLSVDGRAQSLRIGEAFQRRGIEVTIVWSSQWCRTRETADLAFPGKRTDQPLFNSFFNAPERGPAQTRAALDLLASWRGSGVLVVVSHQLNITALTGIVPNSAEGVVIALRGRDLKVLGRITP
ncbi:histidine phosphatase family protein [Rhodoferax sp.]|uniref:histidine phosphatase family protein n=1 Tax=Rhodoferax sp. TaxID=50421 RepID=UPI0025EE0A52|nr:histidine phosphatase family protein [Rhodoferax sp.]